LSVPYAVTHTVASAAVGIYAVTAVLKHVEDGASSDFASDLTNN
jgi:hypothetical protein